MAGGSTDVKNERLPVDGFVIKRDSAVLNKPLINMMRGMYRDNKRDYPTVPAKTSWDEEIFTPKEVDMWGLQNLRAINNSSDNAAHNNIDELIWQSENVMRGYQKGDVVEKQGLLAGLLSMLSGAGRRQKRRQGAYEEMMPQDMPQDALTADAIQRLLKWDYKPSEMVESVKRDMPRPAQVQDFIDVGLPVQNPEYEHPGIFLDESGQRRMLWEDLEGWDLPRYLQGYQEGDEVEDEKGILSALLNMLSGSGIRQERRQDAYEQMVPQNMIPLSEDPLSAELEHIYKTTSPAAGRKLWEETGGEQGWWKKYGNIDERKRMIDILKGITPSTQSYQDGDEVGYQDGKRVVDPNDPLNIDARMQMGAQAYPGGISPVWGDTASVTPGARQPSLEDVAEFDKMIKMLMVQEALQKARQAGEQVNPQGIERRSESYPLDSLVESKYKGKAGMQFPKFDFPPNWQGYNPPR